MPRIERSGAKETFSVSVSPAAKRLLERAVVAFAAVEGGGVVYTSDVDDLERIATLCFPSVRVLGI